MPNSHLLITRQTLYPCPPLLTATYGSTLYYIVHSIYQCPHRSQPHMEVHCIILCIPYINVPIAHSRIWKYTVFYSASHISRSRSLSAAYGNALYYIVHPIYQCPQSLTAAYGSTLYYIVHPIYQCPHRSQTHMEVHCSILCIPYINVPNRSQPHMEVPCILLCIQYINVPIAHSRIWKYTVLYCASYINVPNRSQPHMEVHCIILCIPYINVPIAHSRIWKYTVLYCASHISISPSLNTAYGSTMYSIVHLIYQCPHRSQPHMEVHCIILCIPCINVPIALSRIWKYTVLYCASHISISPSLKAAYGSTMYSIVHLIYQCPHRSQPHMEVHCIILCIPCINVPIALSRI